MGVRTEQDRARERARHMVDLLARDEIEQLSGVAGEVIGDEATERRQLYPLLVEITDACAQMINGRAGEIAPQTLFVLDLVGEDEQDIDIDQIPPALRALLRAILALLEQHRDDAEFQLSMAADDPHQRGRLDALVHGLLCVQSLLSAGGRANAPAWLL